jgi:hypothetical protein
MLDQEKSGNPVADDRRPLLLLLPTVLGKGFPRFPDRGRTQFLKERLGAKFLPSLS